MDRVPITPRHRGNLERNGFNYCPHSILKFLAVERKYQPSLFTKESVRAERHYRNVAATGHILYNSLGAEEDLNQVLYVSTLVRLAEIGHICCVGALGKLGSAAAGRSDQP